MSVININRANLSSISKDVVKSFNELYDSGEIVGYCISCITINGELHTFYDVQNDPASVLGAIENSKMVLWNDVYGEDQ